MLRSLNTLPITGLCVLLVSACAPDYSPNTYSSNAVQLANKVEAGVVVGFREVQISASGNVGTVTGGAAGGILGAQYGNSALAAIGGAAVGSIVGRSLDHATGDTTGWEYIVRKGNGDMLSVTQREEKPLALGQKVLVINGPQARVVPDYSIAAEPPPPPPKEKVEAKEKPESNVKVEVVFSLPPGVSAQALGAQTAATPPPPVGTIVPVSVVPVPVPAVAERPVETPAVSPSAGSTPANESAAPEQDKTPPGQP